MKSCPRDSEILASNDVEGYRYYSCAACGGLWIPGSALQKTMRPAAVQDLLARCASAPPANLSCPDAHGLLVALPIEDCEIDLCARCHAVWLDRDEILRISRCFRPATALLADVSTIRGPSPAYTGTVILDGLFQILTLLAR